MGTFTHSPLHTLVTHPARLLQSIYMRVVTRTSRNCLSLCFLRRFGDHYANWPLRHNDLQRSDRARYIRQHHSPLPRFSILLSFNQSCILMPSIYAHARTPSHSRVSTRPPPISQPQNIIDTDAVMVASENSSLVANVARSASASAAAAALKRSSAGTFSSSRCERN